LFGFVIGAETPESKLGELAELIGRYEGFYKEGSRAQRNNNPGNLKGVSWSTTKTGLDNKGFAIYATEQDGWNDLLAFLGSKANEGYNISELMYLYAPKGENNTESYIDFIAKSLGVARDVRLNKL